MVKSALTWLSTTVLHLRNFLSRFLPLHSPPLLSPRSSRRIHCLVPRKFYFPGTSTNSNRSIRRIQRCLKIQGPPERRIAEVRGFKIVNGQGREIFFFPLTNSRVSVVRRIDALADFQILSACANRIKASACRKCRMKLKRLAH